MHWSTFGKINILNGIWWEFIETLKLEFKLNQGNSQRQEDLKNYKNVNFLSAKVTNQMEIGKCLKMIMMIIVVISTVNWFSRVTCLWKSENQPARYVRKTNSGKVNFCKIFKENTKGILGEKIYLFSFSFCVLIIKSNLIFERN